MRNGGRGEGKVGQGKCPEQPCRRQRVPHIGGYPEAFSFEWPAVTILRSCGGPSDLRRAETGLLHRLPWLRVRHVDGDRDVPRIVGAELDSSKESADQRAPLRAQGGKVPYIPTPQLANEHRP